MPLYEYRCVYESCYRELGLLTLRAATQDRDAQQCPRCRSFLKRRYVAPHAAPIPGIPNRVNRHWNEDGAAIDTHAVDALVEGADRS